MMNRMNHMTLLAGLMAVGTQTKRQAPRSYFSAEENRDLNRQRKAKKRKRKAKEASRRRNRS